MQYAPTGTGIIRTANIKMFRLLTCHVKLLRMIIAIDCLGQFFPLRVFTIPVCVSENASVYTASC